MICSSIDWKVWSLKDLGPAMLLLFLFFFATELSTIKAIQRACMQDNKSTSVVKQVQHVHCCCQSKKLKPAFQETERAPSQTSLPHSLDQWWTLKKHDVCDVICLMSQFNLTISPDSLDNLTISPDSLDHSKKAAKHALGLLARIGGWRRWRRQSRRRPRLLQDQPVRAWRYMDVDIKSWYQRSILCF